MRAQAIPLWQANGFQQDTQSALAAGIGSTPLMDRSIATDCATAITATKLPKPAPPGRRAWEAIQIASSLEKAPACRAELDRFQHLVATDVLLASEVGEGA